MAQGILFSILAGLMISLQGVFNSRVSEKIGFWQTNVFVHVTGFLLAFTLLIFLGNFNFSNIKGIHPLYLIGGFLGVFIIFTVMKGITSLGASYSVAIILVTQVIVSFLFNKFGLFGESVLHFSLPKYLGLAIMTVGIIIYQVFG